MQMEKEGRTKRTVRSLERTGGRGKEDLASAARREKEEGLGTKRTKTTISKEKKKES